VQTSDVVIASVIGAFVGAGLLQSLVFSQTTGPQKPSLAISSMYGRDLFEFYCASCHGRDGRGRGPVVPALRVVSPDLITIATRNGGTFPHARVESFVTGDQVEPTPAHGSRGMPVWGPIFRGLDANDAVNKVRVANIVGYVESIQVK
jgi:mono/diheme cytochrome c family protein